MATLMRNAGIDWRGYMESLPVGSTGTADAPQYVGRHNPFAFFNDVTSDYNYATNHIRPYSFFADDLANGRVGRYNWITPNLTNDMHDLAQGSSSAIKQGDTWLSQELPRIMASPAYSNNGAIFITFDESLASTTNSIAMILLSPLAKGNGYSTTNFYDHSSMVRTMQDIFGIRPYLGEAATAQNLNELFRSIKLSSAMVNGLCNVTLSDLPLGKPNYLQASSNMVNWTTIGIFTASSPNETVTLTDPGSANRAQRFYRIIETP
jgi:hypothetical protein